MLLDMWSRQFFIEILFLGGSRLRQADNLC